MVNILVLPLTGIAFLPMIFQDLISQSAFLFPVLICSNDITTSLFYECRVHLLDSIQ